MPRRSLSNSAIQIINLLLSPTACDKIRLQAYHFVLFLGIGVAKFIG